jgi:lysophospholipase L1-like esterase
MKKQLLAVGDSFTWGDELADPYDAWPYQLADLLDYEVHNLGLSGASNASILRRTLEELAVNSYDLVVIGWTSAGRIEWQDDTGIAYNMWPGHAGSSEFFVNQPWRLELLSYISQHHNSAYLYQQYLIQVISLQCYFEANNIEYRMMDTVYNNYYRKVGAEQHDQLAANIRTGKFIGWGEFGMSELTQDCPRGPGLHPLQKGHKKIAREIYQRLK